jgi:hypothetical protein
MAAVSSLLADRPSPVDAGKGYGRAPSSYPEPQGIWPPFILLVFLLLFRAFVIAILVRHHDHYHRLMFLPFVGRLLGPSGVNCLLARGAEERSGMRPASGDNRISAVDKDALYVSRDTWRPSESTQCTSYTLLGGRAAGDGSQS